MSSIIATDGVPAPPARQPGPTGFVYSNGALARAIASAGLLVAFNGDVTALVRLFAHRWWEQRIHNQRALAFKAHLLFRENPAVCSLPVHI